MQGVVHIYGDGILGLMLAFELTKAGCRATVHGDAQNRGASSAAGGMLAPAAESECGSTLVLDTGFKSLALWQELHETTSWGKAASFRGSLLVAHGRDHVLLDEFYRRCHTLAPAAQVEHLTTIALQQREPVLAQRFHKALWIPNEGMIDPRILLTTLRHDLTRRGVNFLTHDCLVDFAGKHDDGVSLHCLGSADTAHWPSLRSIRGEAITVHAPNVRLSHSIRVMHPRYPLYIVPRDNERFYIGATQIESDDISPLSVRSALELLSAAASLDPNFLEARIEATHIGLRPTLRHGEPRIKKTSSGYAINGLYRHGILLAPYVARSTVALLLHNETSPFFIPDEA